MRRRELAAMVIASMAAGNAHAVDLQQFKPAPGIDDVLAIEAPVSLSDDEWSALVALHYANRPFRLVDAGTNRTVGSVVGHQTSIDLAASKGTPKIFGRATEVGLAIPVTINQAAGGASRVDPSLPSSVPAQALGDLRIVGKAEIGSWHGLDAGVALPISLPTARGDSFLGHRGVTARPMGIGQVTLGPITTIGNLGLAVRSDESFRNFHQGTAIEAGLAGILPFRVRGRDLAGVATAAGEYGLAGSGVQGAPVELSAGLRWKDHAHGTVFTLGAARGMTRGAGTPDYRLFLVAGFSPVRRAPRIVIEEKPPEPGEVRVARDRTKLLVTSPVHFATGKDIILEESFPLLQTVADTLIANPWIRRVRVEGHTDNQGNAKYNLDLSQLRAISVARFLVTRGVEPDILQPVGFGITKPIASNETNEGRAKNRRVEFIITETDETESQEIKTVAPVTPPAGATPTATPAATPVATPSAAASPTATPSAPAATPTAPVATPTAPAASPVASPTP